SAFPSFAAPTPATEPTPAARFPFLRRRRSACEWRRLGPYLADPIRTKRSPVETWRQSLRSSCHFFRLQKLPQALQFAGFNTLVFENIQDQQLVRVLEEPRHQVPDFRTRRFFALH